MKSWSIFKITSHQISNFSIKMWDVTLMGVRGLFEIISCQISNWKDFSLKCGILPQWWSGEKSTHCQISDLKYFGLKNVSLYLIFLFPSPHFSFPSPSFFFPFTQFLRCWGRFSMKIFPSTFENIIFSSLRIFFFPFTPFFLPLSLFSSLPLIF